MLLGAFVHPSGVIVAISPVRHRKSRAGVLLGGLDREGMATGVRGEVDGAIAAESANGFVGRVGEDDLPPRALDTRGCLGVRMGFCDPPGSRFRARSLGI